MNACEDVGANFGQILQHDITNYNNIEGLNGRVFTSKVNGNTLFIPATGYRSGSDIHDVGSGCNLWSSSLYLDNPSSAYSLDFGSDDISMGNYYRYYGFSVCPVINLLTGITNISYFMAS